MLKTKAKVWPVESNKVLNETNKTTETQIKQDNLSKNSHVKLFQFSWAKKNPFGVINIIILLAILVVAVDARNQAEKAYRSASTARYIAEEASSHAEEASCYARKSYEASIEAFPFHRTRC